MIRSTKTTLKYSNSNKKQIIKTFINEYKNVIKQLINILWEKDEIPKLITKDITSQINTWLSARMIQCAAKQASGIVRGTRIKQKKRLYIINKLIEEGKTRKTKKLQRIYDKTKISKPNINDIQPELDSRFVKIDLDNDTVFDGWITLASIGNKLKLILPFKKTRHFNKLCKKGNIKTGIRLSTTEATFMFELPDKPEKQSGTILGIDIGKTDVITCSNGYTSKKNEHGYDLNSILQIMSRKRKGSKAFERSVSHRTNYVNWTINNLNLKDVKQINIERIKQMRKNKRTSRMLSHWTYTDIFDKLASKCEEQGVLVNRISPTYTSQRCSECGWVRKGNRKGKLFKCDQCGYNADADLNASLNIVLNLPAISKKKRQSHENRKGFYWKEIG